MQEKVFTEIKIEVGKIYLALLKKDLKVTSTLDEFQRKWEFRKFTRASLQITSYLTWGDWI